jgi:peptidoglycan hydrolase FlgJ
VIGDPSRARHMMPLAPTAPTAPVASAPGEDPKLRKVAQQMEGVFVQELYKAMRATVPQNDGVVGGGAGEEMFTGLMDQYLATETPHAWGRGLGEAIYEHLRGRIAREGAAAAPGAAADAPHDARHDAAPGDPQATQQSTDVTAPSALAPTPTPLSLRSTLQPMLLTPSRDAGR